MFGFKPAKYAPHLALAIENSFRVYLISSIDRLGRFTPPNRFYFDPYILGYTVTLENLFSTHVLKLGHVKPENRARLTFEVIKLLSISPKEAVELEDLLLHRWHILQQNEDFGKGADDAIKNFGIVHGLTSRTHADPKIIEARKLGRELVAAGLCNSVDDGQVVALSKLTLGQQIASRFPSL